MPRKTSVHHCGMPRSNRYAMQLLAFSPPRPCNSPTCVFSDYTSNLHLPLVCNIYIIPSPSGYPLDELALLNFEYWMRLQHHF